MRRLFQYLLRKPLTWMANKWSGKPDKEAVFTSLSNLYKSSSKKKNTRLKILTANITTDNFIIFSDQHKGNGDKADDFKSNEFNYLEALNFYREQGFTFINLGDSEELWKYKASEVIPANIKTLELEAQFHPSKYIKTFGNHDLLWKNKWDTELLLKNYFALPLLVYEGILIKTHIDEKPLNIFLTHGHQGDKMSDNNAFSTWLVAHIWAPIQRYLQINVNSPSKDDLLKHKHNKIMYEWSKSKKNTILITGHTHSPVFAAGRYSNHPNNKINGKENEEIKPSYFNTGCCCFNDGDITGIEISKNNISLIKWHTENGISKKKLLEEISFKELIEDLNSF